MPLSVESLAIAMTSKFFQGNGWQVLPVTRLAGAHAGYDLFLSKGNSRLKVEVKGSSKPYHGIPDLYGSEVDDAGRLVADILCVCYFPPDAQEKLAIIRRADIPLGGLVPKTGYRIKSEHKNRKSIAGKLIEIGDPWIDLPSATRSPPLASDRPPGAPYLDFETWASPQGRRLPIQ